MSYEFADVDKVVADIVKSFQPPLDMTAEEWSEKYRYLSLESSARPGLCDLDWTPYFREPLEMATRSDVSSIALMTAAQVGKSTFIENIIGFSMHIDPCSMLHISPTLSSRDMFSKERLAPMIRDTPVLKGLVKDARTRDSGNTLGLKMFPGGFLAMVGSNSPTGLASRPIRKMLADEVDRFEASAGTEGDPLKLGEKRTTTYPGSLNVYVSTPGNKYDPKEGTGSRIEKEFLDGDQRRYHAKCPHCGELQILVWSQVRWVDSDPLTAHYVCIHNDCKWTEGDRSKAVLNGRWIASKPFTGKVSYHLPQMASRLVKLSDAVKEHYASMGNPEMRKTWVNTVLGETWEDKGARVDWSDLMDRREEYNAFTNIPEAITVITLAVDVNGDWLEYEFIGWGSGDRSWSLHHGKIYGDITDPNTWDELDAVRGQIFIHPIFGDMVTRVTLVDSGYMTETVYEYCRKRHRVLAVKGVSGFSKPHVASSSKNTLDGMRIFNLGVDSIKELAAARLKITDSEKPGYCHFPTRYEEDYFLGLTAEELITKRRKGFGVPEWKKIRNRNEPWDLRVMNIAALEMLMIDLEATRRNMLRNAEKRDTPAKIPENKPKKQPVKNWATDWKND